MKYGNTVALDNVSFSAKKGEILGLLGPNGAGKTTLMRILTTYLYPFQGTAIVCGHDILKEPLKVREIIGYMPESVPLYEEMTVEEYINFVAKARNLEGKTLYERINWVKDTCELKEVWKHNISELSRGYRQRVGLAQALIHNPSVLILDEPTTGLDPLQIVSIRKLIRQLAEDKTIIFSTHILQEVEALTDRIVILNNGRVIADGKKNEIISLSGVSEKLVFTVKAEKEDIESLFKKEGLGGWEFIGKVSEGYLKFSFLLDKGKKDYLVGMLERIFKEKNYLIGEKEIKQPTLEEAFISLLKKR
jgi:ABC-2 type transport system ATP-binding protein